MLLYLVFENFNFEKKYFLADTLPNTEPNNNKGERKIVRSYYTAPGSRSMIMMMHDVHQHHLLPAAAACLLGRPLVLLVQVRRSD